MAGPLKSRLLHLLLLLTVLLVASGAARSLAARHDQLTTGLLIAGLIFGGVFLALAGLPR